MEKLTSGEIRVAVKEKKFLSERNKEIRQLAEKEFHKLNMHNTRDKTGILLFLLLSKRQFYILADSGIDSRVGQKTWEDIRDEIQTRFQIGKFGEGLVWGIERVGRILGEHFPIKSDDSNELSNKVVIG
jgi:uncharacterized membrane protein